MIIITPVPSDHRIKLKECEKKDKYLNLAWELKKLWNMLVTIIPILIGAFWYSQQRIIKGPGGLGSWQPSEGHHNYSIIENGQNTKASPGDLFLLKLQGKNHQLKLMWKILAE